MARGLGGMKPPEPSHSGSGGSRNFVANFPGECWICEDRINRGDTVRYCDDEVVHAECAL